MSSEQIGLPHEIINDVQHFISLFTAFHAAMPDETQHTFRQIIRQIRETKNVPEETYLKGKTGLEPIWTFERSGVKVSKRIFHPGRGERLTGADFFLSKKKTLKTVRVTAVQTKRNGGKPFFKFEQRDLDQLEKFSQSWRSAYYLMVDETVTPPIDCFITVYELKRLIAHNQTAPPIKILNSEVREYCRGSNLFYDTFYRCKRGSEYNEEELMIVAFNYAKLTKRVLIELLAEKRRF
jgi:hypothetical protein